MDETILFLDMSFRSKLLLGKYTRQTSAFTKYCRKREEILSGKYSNIYLIPVEFLRDCHVLMKYPPLLKHLLLKEGADEEFVFFFLRGKSDHEFDYLFSSLDETWKCKISFIERAIQENYQTFRFLQREKQEEKEYIPKDLKLNRLVELNPEIIRYLIKIDGFDIELLKKACKKNISLLRFIPCDRDFHISVIEHNPQALKYSKDLFRNDEEIVLRAITKDKTTLQYASDSIIERVLVRKELLKYSVEDIKSLVLSGVKTKPSLFKYLPDSVKIDQEFVLKLLPNVRVFIPQSLKQSREFRMEWVKYDAKAFETCKDLELRSERQFLLNSLTTYRHTLRDAPPILKDDKEFVLECLKFPSNRLSETSERLRDDEQVVSCALMQQSSINFEYASDRLRDDKEFVMKNIELFPGMFSHISERLKKDKEIIVKYASTGKLKSLENEFMEDEGFVLDIVEKNPQLVLSFIPPIDSLFIRK
ncbi:predicted protein [Naegleria gruberi]|uniref:Predicted protein n=1 Tax=Naegleria gruberi TaxID=5762 RepID=D2W0F4_NAEGR|nr:uncharacterized protein NAEGRDRAFT_53713 [Naegleria gruberi]EFC37465.1 predicted protein [Naegleria gruberi]|eukprot:XP_002670209.1 predicted protein [Naegleria gruberi strain NEG-M]